MKVFVTGGTGFLGAALVDELVLSGCDVSILARKTSNLSRIAKHTNDIKIFYIENINLEKLFTSNNKIDAIVHAATTYGRGENSFEEVFTGNVKFPMDLLNLAARSRVPKFINIDTFFNQPNLNYSYLQSYTLSKKHFQEWGRLIGLSNSIDFLNLRLFHLYGPGDGPEKFVTKLAMDCLKGKEINLTSGTQVRDFIYLKDAIAAIKLALSLDRIPGYRHFDVGTGAGVSIREFVLEVNLICGEKSYLNFGSIPMREGELMSLIADCSDLNNLGWFAKTKLSSGIVEIVNELKRVSN
jgi:nucleoside-diphosphate-sugar epimerase